MASLAISSTRHPPPDTITILDLGVSPVMSDVPGSVVGPPFSVAITPLRGSRSNVGVAMQSR
jgi:hypothetical protein